MPFENANGDGGVLRFGPPTGAGISCPEATPLTVTRLDADTWTVEFFADDVACLAVQGPGGHYHMPFLMTLVRIP